MKTQEVINWTIWGPQKPEDFPCMIQECNREALLITKITKGVLTLNLCLCAFHAGTPEDELIGRFLKKRK